MRLWHRVVLLTALLVGPFRPVAAQQGQTPEALLARMTPDERVGQLFLVTFEGATVEPGSDIDRLIREYRVGGVLLRASSSNFTDESNAPAQVLTLTNALQGVAVAAAQDSSGAPIGVYVPLTVALQQPGGGAPYDQILSGLTELPTPLALGATWDPDLAEAVGRVAGAELSALGVNLLIGPSPDVLDMARVTGVRDEGSQVFGGDPFWVAELSQAYYRGAQVGGGGRLAVAAPHFPGQGASNRDWDQEIPTIRVSLEQLIRVDLLPFSRLAEGVVGERIDALVTAHIRFQGLLERQTANPITLDAPSLDALLGQGALAEWRSGGGILISDSLGTRAIRRFLDSTEATFNGRGLARDAFRAGHDVLLLADFGQRSTQAANIIDVIEYFRDQYASDTTFARRVDESVLRILALKLRTAGGAFTPEAARRDADPLPALLGHGGAATSAVARAAATLIFPSRAELASRLNDPPGAGDRIVFVTDNRTVRQCPVCIPRPAMDSRALENAVLALYGPNASGQVHGRNLQSFTFEELTDYLEGRLDEAAVEGQPTPEPPAIDLWLRQTDWIVFNLLDVSASLPETGVLSRFLTQRQDLGRGKRIIIFSYGAPYYLDATDLSNVTGASYALFSRGSAFVETAARILFQDINAIGASPVSVPGINLVLFDQLQPDPNEVIELFSDSPGVTATESVSVTYALNSTVTLRTSRIRDRNGNPVPDGAALAFEIAVETGAGVANTQVEATTVDGSATGSFVLTQVGFYSVRARTASGLSPFVFTIDVPEEGLGSPGTVLLPTATATATQAPTPTPTPAPVPTEMLEPGPDPANSIDFALMLVVVGLGVVAGYRLGEPALSPRRALRLALAAGMGALIGYNWFALELPGFAEARGLVGQWGGTLWAVLGSGAGLLLGWLVFRRRP